MPKATVVCRAMWVPVVTVFRKGTEGLRSASIERRSTKKLFAIFFAAALVLGYATAAQAAPGDPDTGLDGDGKVATDSASGGALAYSGAPGATAELTFKGRNVAWVAPKSSLRGEAEVYLDGRKVATADLFSATVQARRVIYAANGLDPSVTHTLRVKVLGTSGRPRVDVDAFVVLR